MRLHLLTVIAGASLALISHATSPAHSITLTTQMGFRQAADALHLTEDVHCRKYRHRHKRGHGWSRGCGVEAKTSSPQRSGIVRDGGITPQRTAPASLQNPRRNYINPSNPQDRSGNSNPQDMTQPRSFNPQDMR